MKRIMTIALAALATTAIVGADIADARRLGGGRNVGAQRQSVAPPAAAPAPTPATPAGAAANPVMPAKPAVAPTAGAAPAAAPAASGASRWLGPIAGLAAGLGLAALAAHFGFSEALMSGLLVVLMVVAGFALLRFFMARRSLAGAGAGAPARSGGLRASVPPSGESPRLEPVFGGSRTPAPEAEPARGRYPPGFDPVPFLAQARKQFAQLQAAYDRGDREMMADVMTPELFADVSRELETRGTHVATEVVTLNPEIIEVTTEGGQHWASVRFYGLLREDGATSPKPFDEMWNLVKPAKGSSGWLLAGIRQLDETPAGGA